MKLDDKTLAALAERFCAAPLPESVCADHCATIFGRADRHGTNLLSVYEAGVMLSYVLEILPEPSRKLNGFRCHNCKRIEWTSATISPERCIECRCRDFSAVYPSADDPVEPDVILLPLKPTPEMAVAGANMLDEDDGEVAIGYARGVYWAMVDAAKAAAKDQAPAKVEPHPAGFFTPPDTFFVSQVDAFEKAHPYLDLQKRYNKIDDPLNWGRISYYHPNVDSLFLGWVEGRYSMQNSEADDVQVGIAKLLAGLAGARSNWNKIIEHAGADVNGLNITPEEGQIALGVIDWVEPRLAALVQKDK
jgi:hypothetical protein